MCAFAHVKKIPALCTEHAEYPHASLKVKYIRGYAANIIVALLNVGNAMKLYYCISVEHFNNQPVVNRF